VPERRDLRYALFSAGAREGALRWPGHVRRPALGVGSQESLAAPWLLVAAV